MRKDYTLPNRVRAKFRVGKVLDRRGDFYTAEVWRTTIDPHKPKNGTGFSTFFPDNMTQEQIKAILWAAALKTNMNGGLVPLTSIWPGYAPGVMIKVRKTGGSWIGHPEFH